MRLNSNRIKQPILRYVKLIRNIVTVVCALLAIFSLIALVYAFQGYMGYIILAPVGIVLFIAVYAVYASKISLDTVLGIEVAKNTVHIITKRKTFTYDLQSGCTEVKESDKKYVCTFVTQDSEDKFTFYKTVPFKKPYEVCFEDRDIGVFFSEYAESPFEE